MSLTSFSLSPMSVMKPGFQQSSLDLPGDVEKKPSEEKTEAVQNREAPPLRDDTEEVWQPGLPKAFPYDWFNLFQQEKKKNKVTRFF